MLLPKLIPKAIPLLQTIAKYLPANTFDNWSKTTAKKIMVYGNKFTLTSFPTCQLSVVNNTLSTSLFRPAADQPLAELFSNSDSHLRQYTA